ncbi:hypothetical protein [Pseudomonas asiatica]|nr:hypothetical protein [Pseudomonas shirazica]
MAVESVSGCSWNECPDQRGITVRMCVEWVSESAWNPQAGDEGARRLIAQYYSEGNNVLSTTTARFTPDWSPEVVESGASRFAAEVDDVISDTYAVRLLRHRDQAADGA